MKKESIEYPKTAEDIYEFVRGNFISFKPKNGFEEEQFWIPKSLNDDDVYVMSAHDLLIAFTKWFEGHQ